MYKKKTEAAKKDYLKALAAYRASLVSKVYDLQYSYQIVYVQYNIIILLFHYARGFRFIYTIMLYAVL